MSRPASADKPPIGASVLVGTLLFTLGLVFIAEFPISHRSALVQVEELLLIGYCSVRAGMCVRVDRPRIVALIVFLWVYTLFGLIQTVQLSRNDNPFHVAAPDTLIASQLTVMLLGTAAMDLVATIARSGQPKPAERRRQLSLHRTVALSIVTLLLTPFMIERLGGASSLFSSRLALSIAIGSFQASPSTFNVIVSGLANVAPFLCAFALWRLRRAGRFTFMTHPGLLVLFVLLLVSNVFLNNPISQPRFWIATVVIAVAISGRRLRRVGFQIALIAIYLIVSMVLFPYLAVTRNAPIGQATVTTQPLTYTYLNKTDYGTMQDVAYTVNYVHDHGFTMGKQIAGAALFFVPRSVWPDKAVDTAQLVAIDMGFVQNLNLDSPLWAEGYIDFGLFGVAGIMGLFGFFVGRAERAFRGGSNPAALFSTLVPMFAGYQLILLRGSLLQATGRIALILVLGWLISRRGEPYRDSGVADGDGAGGLMPAREA